MTVVTKLKVLALEDGGQPKKALTAQEKAQLRRQQVRKAQIQHRQRKANYVKKLELDVAEHREMIAAVQREVRALLAENEAIRNHIRARAERQAQELALLQLPEVPELSMLDWDMDSLEDITLTLGFDEAMSAPCFYISSSPEQSSYGSPTATTVSPPKTADPAAHPDLTPEQTQQAINFILALEHICRGHIHPSDYDPTKSSGILGHRASGHTLMATSLALRGAPDSVFEAVSRTGPFNLTPWNPRPHLPPTTSTLDLVPEKSPVDDATLEPPKQPTADSVAPVSWQASGLTLRSLYGLSQSLGLEPDVEITPVQAWFDMAGRWPMDLLLQEETLTTLKRELFGVVKCPHFGAVMEREAYESVVCRVLGPPAYEDGPGSDPFGVDAAAGAAGPFGLAGTTYEGVGVAI